MGLSVSRVAKLDYGYRYRYCSYHDQQLLLLTYSIGDDQQLKLSTLDPSLNQILRWKVSGPADAKTYVIYDPYYSLITKLKLAQNYERGVS